MFSPEIVVDYFDQSISCDFTPVRVIHTTIQNVASFVLVLLFCHSECERNVMACTCRSHLFLLPTFTRVTEQDLTTHAGREECTPKDSCHHHGFFFLVNKKHKRKCVH